MNNFIIIYVSKINVFLFCMYLPHHLTLYSDKALLYLGINIAHMNNTLRTSKAECPMRPTNTTKLQTSLIRLESTVSMTLVLVFTLVYQLEY
jgi:hypothetical protein